MKTFVQVEIPPTALLHGYVVDHDESFDHEFGTEKRRGFEVEDLGMTVWIENIEQPVALSDAWKAYYSERLLAHYWKNCG